MKEYETFLSNLTFDQLAEESMTHRRTEETAQKMGIEEVVRISKERYGKVLQEVNNRLQR